MALINFGESAYIRPPWEIDASPPDLRDSSYFPDQMPLVPPTYVYTDPLNWNFPFPQYAPPPGVQWQGGGAMPSEPGYRPFDPGGAGWFPREPPANYEPELLPEDGQPGEPQPTPPPFVLPPGYVIPPDWNVSPSPTPTPSPTPAPLPFVPPELSTLMGYTLNRLGYGGRLRV